MKQSAHSNDEHRSLSQSIDGHLDPKPYLEYEFEKLANTLPAGPEVDLVLQCCIAFTVKPSTELRLRLPSNYKILQAMTRLSVGACLRVLRNPSWSWRNFLAYIRTR